MKLSFDPKAFEVVPYLRFQADERVINLTSLWDGKEWHAWFPYEQGLIKIQGGEVVEGGYFAQTPEREIDLYLEFIDFMWKRASWTEVSRWLYSIEASIFCIAASLAKIDHFNSFLSDRPERERSDYSSFISTEVEYLLGRCRSLFDDLQQVVAAIWARVRLSDEAAQRRKKDLPVDSFRKAVDRIRTHKPEGGPPYGLPDSVIAAYTNVSKFFYQVREIRDQLTHRGGRLGPILWLSKETRS